MAKESIPQEGINIPEFHDVFFGGPAKNCDANTIWELSECNINDSYSLDDYTMYRATAASTASDPLWLIS